ncbi:P-loop containing nucleoside triphosphate hydrolase protein [Xylogone sp. PMI_703]|nr:P-loop containing nucleoside triphosphate hydrolase protein [Xylogone sp. PMI_703]
MVSESSGVGKPIFVATHPRACSTAFERVFMTRQDVLTCVHEPFGDAFYFGPERMSPRYEQDEKARIDSGFSNSTYKSIFERLERDAKEVRSLLIHFPLVEFRVTLGSILFESAGKRLFIKDIIHYLVPPEEQAAQIAPSLGGKAVRKGVGTNNINNGSPNGNLGSSQENGDHEINGNGIKNGTTSGDKKAPFPYGTEAEPGNPTVVPAEILKQFHFTFLIRHPRSSIPSYYRCTVPPLDSVTGFYDFYPSEAGYDELRRVFDFLRSVGQVGPQLAGEDKELRDGEVRITVIDADDLLDDPVGIIKAYCKEVGLEYDPGMLVWDTDEDHNRAKAAFEKWKGFHDDAINSTSLKPRDAAHKKKPKTIEAENEEWRQKYGEKGQKLIRETVNKNIPDYEYLKSFAIKL